jgi:DNA polymerase III epsilon subunit family exonuclease
VNKDGLFHNGMAFSLIQTLHDTPLAFLDVETTGASADFGHRVIELGIVRVERGRSVAEYQQLIDPQRRISPGVTALTGISQAMVEGQPTFANQLPAAMELLRGAIVLGHNVRFDLSFLGKEFRRSGQQIAEALGNAPVMDTVRIARRRFGRGGNGLQVLAPRLGVYPSIAHRALADAQTTAGVFEKLMEPVGGWGMCLCDAIREQGGPMGLLPVTPRESLLPLELEEALEQRKPVRMIYLDARQSRTERVIQPMHIRRTNGELMLVAHCQLRGEQRTFKIERIVQLIRTDCTETATRVESEYVEQPTLFPAAANDAAREQVAVDPEPDRAAAIDSGSIREPPAAARLSSSICLPRIHQRLPRDRPTGFCHHHGALCAGSILRGNEEPQALFLCLPKQGHLLRGGGQHDLR